MMIYLTGDTHGEQNVFLVNPLSNGFDLSDERCSFDDWIIAPSFSRFSSEDILIVCGDFGYLWTGLSAEEVYLDALSKKLPFTLAFLDGNHENFPLIESHLKTSWKGGQIHYIRNNIYHLIRGEIYVVDGLRIFTFGGAASTDSMHRIPGVSWWPQEVPSREEIEYARENLRQHDNHVDFILTHTAPVEIARRYQKSNYKRCYSDRSFTDFLEEISLSVEHRAWIHGHLHVNAVINHPKMGLFQCLYDNIICVNELL